MAGGRCGSRLTALLAAWVVAAASEAGPKQAAMPEEQSLVLPMTASNWTLVMEGEWMLKFYAPWCPSCQQTDSEWETFARNGEILHISVGKVDVIQEPGLSGRFFVTTLPAFFHAKDGIFRRYRGPGIFEDLQNYILEKKWQSVEPLTGWKSPASLTMSGMAGLFSISGKIWHLHNYFTVTLGIPAWCSYVLFVIATLIFGLLMGLILVVISECFYVPFPRHLSEHSAGSAGGFFYPSATTNLSSALPCTIMTAIMGIFQLYYSLMGPLWYLQYYVAQQSQRSEEAHGAEQLQDAEEEKDDSNEEENKDSLVDDEEEKDDFGDEDEAEEQEEDDSPDAGAEEERSDTRDQRSLREAQGEGEPEDTAEAAPEQPPCSAGTQVAEDALRQRKNQHADKELNWNRNSRWKLYPRMLQDVSEIDMSTSVLGQRVSMPICVGATAMQCMAHVDGELATVRACRSLGTGMMLSSWATSSIEEVAEAAHEALRWLQLYIYKDREVTKQLVRRAERMGYKAIFVTVDTPYLGNRFDDVRNRFKLPPQLRMKNFETNDLAFSPKENFGDNSGLATYVAKAIDPSINWEDIKWLRGLTSLPIVAKGILRGDDAIKAVKHGLDGILVSNHGARQLDGVPATIDALPEIVEAVEGKVEVFLDGGVRKGTDVLKALALGAKAVFVGRPIIWGLASQGEKGVQEVLEILKEEFRLAMALSGCQNVKVIDKTLVRKNPLALSRI